MRTNRMNIARIIAVTGFLAVTLVLILKASGSFSSNDAFIMILLMLAVSALRGIRKR